jgi:hypothetical protein
VPKVQNWNIWYIEFFLFFIQFWCIFFLWIDCGESFW